MRIFDVLSNQKRSRMSCDVVFVFLKKCEVPSYRALLLEFLFSNLQAILVLSKFKGKFLKSKKKPLLILSLPLTCFLYSNPERGILLTPYVLSVGASALSFLSSSSLPRTRVKNNFLPKNIIHAPNSYLHYRWKGFLFSHSL